MTNIEVGKPYTFKVMVLTEFEDIPSEIMMTAMSDCLNNKMNVLGLKFKVLENDGDKR